MGTLLRGPLRDQTHGELVYSPLEFHERSELFIGVHNETVSIAVSVYDPY
jgi:hypothetical protein